MGYRIDLVVEGANGRRLAVECDGDKYHGPERWADDMRRQRILERVGWRFWRCWSSSFTLDPDGCMLDLITMLNRHGIEPGGAAHGQGSFTLTRHRARNRPRAEKARRAGSSRQARSRHRKMTTRKALSERDGIRLGDRVVIRYLDDNRTATFTLSTARDDEANGVLGSDSPLGRVLLGAAEEDEVEFEAGGRTRRVLIVRTERPASAA